MFQLVILSIRPFYFQSTSYLHMIDLKQRSFELLVMGQGNTSHPSSRITASDHRSTWPQMLSPSVATSGIRGKYTRVSCDPLGTSPRAPVIFCSYLARIQKYLISCLSSVWRLNMYKFNTIVIKVSSPWTNVVLFCVDIQSRQQKPETLTLTILMLLDIKILEDNHRLNRQHQFVIKYRIQTVVTFELSNNLFCFKIFCYFSSMYGIFRRKFNACPLKLAN